MADCEITFDKITVLSCDEKKLSRASRFGNRFSKMVRIGRGTFGEVWKGYDSVHQCWVAVKKFNEVNSDHLGVNMMVIREISLLRKLKHPNITKTLDVLIGKDINSESLLLVMELEDMDLYSYQRKFEKNINMSTVKLIMKQILDGCSYLHSNNVMHRDLKPDNILICTGTSAIRIADFGYARSFTHTINSAISSVRYSWPIQAPSYKAPEVLLGCDNYTSAVDVWSIGCIFGELLSGGCKLFRTAVVETDLKSTEIKVGDKRRRSEVDTKLEDDDGEGSLRAGISSASSSRVRTETLVASLNAIFELLGQVSDSHAPDLRLLRHYSKFEAYTKNCCVNASTTRDQIMFVGNREVQVVIDKLLSGMVPEMRCLNAAKLLVSLVSLDPVKRPSCYSVLSDAAFLNENSV